MDIPKIASPLDARPPAVMGLRQLQNLHVQLTAKLITWCYANGYALSWGETYRTPEQSILNAQSGAGITHSLHTLRLAVDLQLFKDGVYLTNSADYKPLGEYWESLHPLCCWGGRFITRIDGNHFSLTFMGVK